jgi:hypothetical protein
MQKSRIKLIDLFWIGLTSLGLMAYGWYLGQLHQSGYDVAGIFLFMDGLIGFMLALLVRYLTRNYSWYNTWYSNLLTGVFSCAILFAVILVLARLHG